MIWRVAAIAAAAAMALFNASTARAVVLDFVDFNDQAPGQVITNQYLGSGVAFSLVGTSIPTGPTIFEVPVPPNAFNLTGGNLVPGAKTFGVPQYDLRMTFSQRIDFLSIYALDAEEGFTLEAYLDGELVATGITSIIGALGLPAAGPVAFASIGAVDGGIHFDEVIIDITNGDGSAGGGPENFDNLTLHRVPEPATLGVFAAGLALLFVLRRRRDKESSQGNFFVLRQNLLGRFCRDAV